MRRLADVWHRCLPQETRAQSGSARSCVLEQPWPGLPRMRASVPRYGRSRGTRAERQHTLARWVFRMRSTASWPTFPMPTDGCYAVPTGAERGVSTGSQPHDCTRAAHCLPSLTSSSVWPANVGASVPRVGTNMVAATMQARARSRCSDSSADAAQQAACVPRRMEIGKSVSTSVLQQYSASGLWLNRSACHFY